MEPNTFGWSKGIREASKILSLQFPADKNNIEINHALPVVHAGNLVTGDLAEGGQTLGGSKV